MTPVAKHTHIRASLDDGSELRFDDARRFGRVAYGSRDALIAARVLPKLGVEPLSDAFSQERLDAVLRTTTRTVKAALLDQKGVAGLGNIYIDEACFLAGVRPTRRCHRLTRRERAALLDADPARAHRRGRQPRQQRRRLPRCLERARQQPGAPPGVWARRAALLRAAGRRCAAPSPPAAPRCTARTASDDPGHHRELRRRSAARRPGRRACTACALHWSGAGCVCTRSRDAASTRSTSRGAPAGRRSTSPCSSTDIRRSCCAPRRT